MKFADGIFVTGTDTDVGKTLVSAILVSHLRKSTDVRYWKPIQTGIESDDDTVTVQRLATCIDRDILRDGIRLEKPLSPHLSAKLAGLDVRIKDVPEPIASVDFDGTIIVEGAGGVLVPLNDGELVVDLIAVLGMRAVVVSRTGLGTINHTLLTIEALRNRKIPVSGVIMDGERNDQNRLAVEHFGQVKVIAEVSLFEEVTPEVVSAFAGTLDFTI